MLATQVFTACSLEVYSLIEKKGINMLVKQGAASERELQKPG